MHYDHLAARLSTLLLGVAVFAACGDGSDPTTLTPDGPAFASSGPVLVECPVDYEISTTGTLGATGGAIRLENHELAVPALALILTTTFEVAAPISNYMELSVQADGASSFEFEKPVSITIDYSRCSRSNIDKAALSVWHIDPVSKALLENMGGVDDKVNRTITFQTDHLSHFSVAH